MKKNNLFHIALVMIFMMYFSVVSESKATFSSITVEDTYADAPLKAMANQLMLAFEKVWGEIGANIATSEQHSKVMGEIQEEISENMLHVLPDDLVCETISITAKDGIESVLHTQANQRKLRNGLMESVLGETNTFGSQLPSEILINRMQRFKQNYCNPQASNDGLSGFCPVTPPLDTQINAHLDPTSCWGWETKDADLTAGQSDEACRSFLSYVSPENKPIRLPSAAVLGASGAGRHHDEIVEFYEPLKQSASLIADTLAGQSAKHMKSPGASVNEFRTLLENVGFSAVEIERYIPVSGGGVSEHAQLEILSKFMIMNPDFMIRLQTNESNITRVRTLLRTLSLRLDNNISDLIADKGRHMASIHAINIRPRRKQANAMLLRVNNEQ